MDIMNVKGRKLLGIFMNPAEDLLNKWRLNLVFEWVQSSVPKVFIEVIDSLEIIKGLLVKAASNMNKTIELMVEKGSLLIMRFLKGEIMTFSLDKVTYNY